MREPKKNILKYFHELGKAQPTNHDNAKSLFDEMDYSFTQPTEESEFDKAYKGQTSKIDAISFDEEYRGRKVVIPAVLRSPTTDDEENTSKSHKKSFVMPHPPVTTPKPAISVVAVQQRNDDVEKIDRALAIAEDFAKRERLIIVSGAIYHYNGIFYSLLSDDAAQRLIFQNYRSEISRTSPVSILKNVATLLKFCTNKVFEEFPANSHLIVFKNGTLEVSSGRFRANSPDDLANSALGIEYDSDRWKMPYIKHFLETIADGDIDLYELMLQVIGYILSNDIKAKAFFYLEGIGDAGKSRFCDLIASFFPISGTNKVARIALQDLGGKFSLGNLVNSKLNISEDLPDNPLSQTTVSRIKMISDANRLEAEAKYVQSFSFKPLCKLLFASNHPLRLKESDAAFINRVVYIPFMNAIPKEKQDKNILEKMHEELPALFNRAFAAYKRLVENGYMWAGSDRFKPEISIANSGISMDKEQIIKRFIATCCEFEQNAIVSTEELRYVYDKYCHQVNHLPIAGDRFSRELSAILPDTVKRIKIGNQRRGYQGIKIKSQISSYIL
jgi:P4 family phage/plasmid primase-like protien